VTTHRVAGLVLTVFLIAPGAFAEKAAPLSALARMPVREVTVFKDGHAFVLHSGAMPTDTAGNVVMDYLPAPVVGTFWPYSAEKGAKLAAVTASQRKVLVERTALDLKELVEANVGADVFVTEAQVVEGEKRPYRATILGVPTSSGEEQEANSPPPAGQLLPKQGSVVLLRVTEGASPGVRVVALDRIVGLTFAGEHKARVASEELRNLLTLKLDWSDGKPRSQAEVGLLYLQLGLRWIPSYKVVIDGHGNATVKLEATLINELTDLEDVTAHLVIGVPSFAFKDTVDPMSLQAAAAQLSQYFQRDAQTAYAFSNAIMTQQALSVGRMSGHESGNEGGRTIDLGPELESGAKAEDLFVFSVKRVSLKKGQRMVVPISEVTLTYKDVYALKVPIAPPPELWRNVDSSRAADLERLLAGPKVMHRIRLTNGADVPLTTAPALILRDDRVLAQALMTYTAPGAESDLDITTAVDIRVKKADRETSRVPNAATWQSDQYGRVDLAGTITLTSFAKQPVTVEVEREVLGNVTAATRNGKVEMVNVLEDSELGRYSPQPPWWGWFNWPWWWRHFNGVGRVSWSVQLEPSQALDLGYTWNYYWR
jgi:hypothetical protein